MQPLTSAGAGLSRIDIRSSSVATSLMLSALAVGYLAVRDPLLGLGAVLIPAVIWIFTRQRLTAFLLAAAIPFAQDVTNGRLGLNVSLSDLLLVLLTLSITAEALAIRSGIPVQALEVIRYPLLQYCGYMLILLALHAGSAGIIGTVQRFELFLLPLVVGAALAAREHEGVVLRGYLIGATVLAATWPFVFDQHNALGINKNPAGGFITTALLLLVGVRSLRRFVPYCLPVLVGGLFWTLSRGAIGSLGLGLIALLILQQRVDRRKFVLLIVPLAIFSAAAFLALPESSQVQATTFTAGTDTAAAYSLKYREAYWADARAEIEAHPLFGVGVGNYLTGTKKDLTLTNDPHQVLLLQAAEGGYGFALSFMLLIVGLVIVLARRARHTTLGPVAAAVTLATVAHGLVDVYWVRATPVMAWLLVGLALGAAHRSPKAITP